MVETKTSIAFRAGGQLLFGFVDFQLLQKIHLLPVYLHSALVHLPHYRPLVTPLVRPEAPLLATSGNGQVLKVGKSGPIIFALSVNPPQAANKPGFDSDTRSPDPNNKP